MAVGDGQGIVVVGLGEAVFDRFVDLDRTVLGGAPLNMAFHAHQILSLFGGLGTVLSRVGRDDLGDRVIRELQVAGIPIDNVQRDSSHATGDVVVRVNERGENQFTITPGVAWDHIEFDDSAERLARTCSAVCFGTLAQRSVPSRDAIHKFIAAATEALIICDVNLRQDFYSLEILRSSLTMADVVKLNAEELKVLSQELNLGAGNEIELASALLREFDLKLLALTRGAKGTQLITSDQILAGDVRRFDANSEADSVGAGDASCAGLVCGMLLDWSLADSLALSNRMGAFVASQPGATPNITEELSEWIRARSSDLS